MRGRNNTMQLGSPSPELIFRYFYCDNLRPYFAFQNSVATSKKEAGRAIAERIAGVACGRSQPFRILDVGCGGGEQTRYFLDSLTRLCPNLKISLVAIDPSARMLDHAAKHLQCLSRSVQLSFKQFAVRPAPEMRLSDLTDGERFDFVLASFVLFHMADWNDALGQFVECLLPLGELCVVLESWGHNNNGRCNHFRRRLFKIANTRFRDVFCSEHFEEVVRKHGMQFESCAIPSVVDLNSGLFGGITETIEFLINVPRWTLSREQEDMVLSLVRQEAISGVIEGWQKVTWVKRG